MKAICKSFIFIALISVCVPTLLFAQKKWVKVAAGGRFSAALRSDGTIWECGRARQGQLGNGNNDTSFVLRFSQTGTDTDWVDVEAGEAHCLALKKDGSLWAWGNNLNGELGVGDSIDRYYPQRVGTDHDWTYISASSYASYAIKKDGSIWGWGFNHDGELGDSNRVDQATPAKIDGAHKWKKICAGYPFSIALRSDGTLWASGFNGDGDLGNGTLQNSTTMLQVNADSDWVDMSSGWNFTIALKKNGTIWSWGYDGDAQLGQGNVTPVSKPKQILSDTDWAKIYTGCLFAFGIKKDGTLWGWGDNYLGELGNGNTNQQDFPLKIGNAADWRMVSGAKGYKISSSTLRGFSTLAIHGDSSRICVTGQNDYGQLGNGTTQSVYQFDCNVNTGIPNVSSQFKGIKVYPNPAHDFVGINLANDITGDYRINLYDVNGKKVLVETTGLALESNQLDISGLKPGVYLLEIVSDKEVYQTKIIKN